MRIGPTSSPSRHIHIIYTVLQWCHCQTRLCLLPVVQMEILPRLVQMRIVEMVASFAKSDFVSLRSCSSYWKAICNDEANTVACNADNLTAAKRCIGALPQLQQITIRGNKLRASTVSEDALSFLEGVAIKRLIFICEHQSEVEVNRGNLCPKMTILNLCTTMLKWKHSLDMIVVMNCNLPTSDSSKLSSPEYFAGFPGLTILQLVGIVCTPAQKTLDLSGCRGLKSLDCLLCNLTSLNVTACTSLTSLNCALNSLAALDLSKCNNLEKLTFDNNKVATVDVSSCLQLTALSCVNNQLTAMDLSMCSRLTDIVCSINRLASLDPPSSTVSLLCVRNNLTALELSACASLQRLRCAFNLVDFLDLTACPTLKDLSCSNNILAALDLSASVCLQYLQCDNNQLLELKFPPAAPDLQSVKCSTNHLVTLDVAGCANMMTLECENNNLTNIVFPEASGLRSLICNLNELSNLDMASCEALQTLACQNCQLVSLNISECASLKFLNCSINSLACIDSSACPVLTHVYCSTNQLRTLDVTACPELRLLECGGNQLSSISLAVGAEVDELHCNDNCDQGCQMVWNGASVSHLECDSSSFELLTPLQRSLLHQVVFGTKEVACEVSGFEKLVYLKCNVGPLGSLDLTGCLASVHVDIICATEDVSFLGRSNVKSMVITAGRFPANLTGFTMLQELVCAVQHISILDLSVCNTVKKVVIRSSEGLSELASINLDDCSSLVDLQCEGLRQLTKLDLSCCKNLKLVKCVACALESLDVTCCPLLTSLDISHSTRLGILVLLDPGILSVLECEDCPRLQIAQKGGYCVLYLEA